MTRVLIFISCLFLVVNGYAETSVCTDHQCIAVVDVGSTGSRLHIFSYDLDETNTATNIKELWSKKATPGFATIESNQSTVDSYLTGLFSGAPVQKLPVYFYATAGMRLVPQTKQKAYYQAVQNWFNQQSEWKLVEAKTIPGNDEALFDWLAINYHLGTIKSSKTNPVGVMDIGGASVQIVFPVEKNSELNKNSLIELHLYGQHINLFVHSFLGLGQNEVSHQYLDTPSCFMEGFPLPDGEVGQGDAASCAQDISSLINHVHKVKSAIQPVLANNRIESWYTLGGLATLAGGKQFHFENNQLTGQDLLQKANSLICHEQWSNLSSQYQNNQYIESFCLLPAFYYALMVDGYGFSANQTVNFFPSAQNMDWTLGVVLHH